MKNPFKMRKGFDPIGTRHICNIVGQGKPHHVTYEVYAVHGLAQFTPSGDEPTVFAKIAQRTALPAEMYISVPLSEFVSISKPAPGTDGADYNRFYESTDIVNV